MQQIAAELQANNDALKGSSDALGAAVAKGTTAAAVRRTRDHLRTQKRNGPG